MARAPDARVDQAKELYQQGKKLVEISAQLEYQKEPSAGGNTPTDGMANVRERKASVRKRRTNDRKE